eukprot:5790244-Alexandrium_andersonii.AAC.1
MERVDAPQAILEWMRGCDAREGAMRGNQQPADPSSCSLMSADGYRVACFKTITSQSCWRVQQPPYDRA